MLKRILNHDHHLRRPRKHKSLQSYYLLVRAFLYHRLTALMIGSIMLANFCHSYHYDHHCHHHHNYHPIWFSLAPSAIRWRQLPYFLITTTLGLSYGYQPICAPWKWQSSSLQSTSSWYSVIYLTIYTPFMGLSYMAAAQDVNFVLYYQWCIVIKITSRTNFYSR